MCLFFDAEPTPARNTRQSTQKQNKDETMTIDQETVHNLAKLASLHISAGEARALAEDLGKTIEFIGKLASLDAAADAPPMTRPFEGADDT
jgi:Asp-tRNA(Asn)/Glu-tRNA(Gln) amidotransferase C subunit